jgi:hypothetical protein
VKERCSVRKEVEQLMGKLRIKVSQGKPTQGGPETLVVRDICAQLVDDAGHHAGWLEAPLNEGNRARFLAWCCFIR